MNKRSGIIEVKDTYSMNTRLTSLTQSFMSVCDIDISIPGKIIFSLPDQNKVYLDYESKLWNVKRSHWY